jgi:hypothetical protein
MIWLLILLLLIIVIFSYLLFAPFYLEINSISDFYGIRFHRMAYAKLIITDNLFKIDLCIAGWRKQIDLLAKPAKGEQKEKQILSERKNKPFKISFGKIKAIMKSFKINKCHLNIDTGNVQLNGILYPGFYWLGKHTNNPIGINFFNETEIILEVENNLARVLKALIIHLFTFKKQKSWTALMNYSAN